MTEKVAMEAEEALQTAISENLPQGVLVLLSKDPKLVDAALPADVYSLHPLIFYSFSDLLIIMCIPSLLGCSIHSCYVVSCTLRLFA